MRKGTVIAENITPRVIGSHFKEFSK